jgi:ATP-dependent DNA ligase
VTISGPYRSSSARRTSPSSSRRLAGGILLSEHIEADGATVLQHTCRLGCEGIVSKRRGAPYRSGRVRTWIKVKKSREPSDDGVWDR